MSKPEAPATVPPRLRAWLDFYQEIGLTPFVRRPKRSSGTAEADETPLPALPVAPPEVMKPKPSLPLLSLVSPPPAATLSLFEEAPTRPKSETLEDVRADLGDCQRCKLAPHRKHIVFGVGNPKAQLVFVGDRKSTRLNSSHIQKSRMPSSA